MAAHGTAVGQQERGCRAPEGRRIAMDLSGEGFFHNGISGLRRHVLRSRQVAWTVILASFSNCVTKSLRLIAVLRVLAFNHLGDTCFQLR
jgi:hypothetical protein